MLGQPQHAAAGDGLLLLLLLLHECLRLQMGW
jgi:hypothetical protein